MPEFRFKLETVLRQRRNRERLAQHELARVQSEIVKLQNQLTDAADQLRSFRNGGESADDRRFISAMTAKSTSLRRRIAAFEADRAVAHAGFAEAARQHKAIQLLREKALTEWRAQQASAEQLALDEAAARVGSEYDSA